MSFRGKRKKKLWGNKWLYIIGACFLVVTLVLVVLQLIGGGVSNLVGQITSPIKQSEGRVNILLLGNAGGRHDGPDLTDSIIVASIDKDEKKAVLFSIPRDLWLSETNSKVNALYAFGKKREDGLGFASEEIGKALGLPIHYAIRVDFSGFEKAIDMVGGIDVEVDKTFDDYLYPITGEEDNLCGNVEAEVDLNEDQAKALNVPLGKRKVLLTPEGKVASADADFPCRFERVHFDQGKLHMSGAVALVYVRSRHGTAGEGSDFARSRRQQKVLESFRDKVLSLETLFNPSKIQGLAQAFGQSFETNIPQAKYLEFYNLSKNLKKVGTYVLGDLGGGKSLFMNPAGGEYGAWVLIPVGNDFTSVRDLVRQSLEGSGSAKLSPEPETQ